MVCVHLHAVVGESDLQTQMLLHLALPYGDRRLDGGGLWLMQRLSKHYEMPFVTGADEGG